LGGCVAPLSLIAPAYDFVLIDCPPSLSLLTLNGLCAAHGVIIPISANISRWRGLTDLVNTIKRGARRLDRPATDRTAARDVRPPQ